jgi:hypothetical protein
MIDPYSMKYIFISQIKLPFLAKFLPASLLGVRDYCQRAPVDETEMI